jgi:hypothetical protein
MRKVLAVWCVMLFSIGGFAQSKTTDKLGEKYASNIFFFYNNTLRMINQGEDKEFDELIKNIEKLKLVFVRKKEKGFGPEQFKKMVADYKSESFEEIMTSRHQGKSFDVYLKEENKTTKGMVVAVNDEDNIYVMDIVGSIALDKVTKFFSTLDQNSEVGQRMKKIADDANGNKDESKKITIGQ